MPGGTRNRDRVTEPAPRPVSPRYTGQVYPPRWYDVPLGLLGLIGFFALIQVVFGVALTLLGQL